MPLSISHCNGSFPFSCFPDTGSATTVLSSDIAVKHRIPINKQAPPANFVSVNGDPVPTTGVVEIVLQAPSSSTKTSAVVSPAVKDEIIVGFKDLKNLGVIPEGFPLRKIDREATQIQALRDSLIIEFKDVLTDSLPGESMGGSPMKIFLTPGQKEPFRISTARPVPHHWEEKAKKAIQQLIDSKVIATMSDPSDWCAPGFFVPKSNGELRLVVDFTGLNRYVRRPIHTFPSSSEIVSGLDPHAQFFAKLDATQGYHQVPLDYDSSKMTTFLLPYGRFRFLRAPMGLSCSSDEFCRRSDEVVRDLPGVRKLVDDILVQAPTMEALKDRISELLKRCRKHHFTLSQKKFEIGRKVNFAGFVISREGVFPNPDKLQGIRDFPAPSDVSSLRSFLGMINQLNNFYPYLAALSKPLLELLRKDVAFVWLPEHQAAFQQIKTKLTGDLALHHFDPSLPTTLLTDASRLHGIGFILIQTPKSGAKRVIQCGSRSLAPAETNYATIELETLAISWAIHKCDFYLKGMQHFKVCTDHRPLLGTFSKPLSRVDNPRIVRLREKVLDYNFSVAWVAGKENIIADALSRSVPKTQPVPHRLCTISPTSNTPISMATIIEHANSCPTFFKIKEALSNNKHPSSLPPDHPARGLREVWHELSVSEEGLLIVGGTRVFIPIPLRAGILKLLHKGHTGLQKTWATAKSLYFWPHMRTHLQQEIDKCEPCQSLKPSLPKEPLIHTTARFPMERASADLFQFGSQHYLVLVDRYSGLPMVNKLRNLSSATIIRVLTELFDTYGWPLSLRTDGGPQFRSEFRAFCVAHDIRHELSSPYHPESNGHAESAVKNVKHLMEKVKPSEFPAAFAAWKNTRRADQPSPNELFFGRQLRIQLPLMSSTLWQAASTQRAPPADPVRFRTLPPLSPGRTVWVQNPHTKRWTTKATVLSTSSTGRTYTLRTEEDKTITRNRRFIRPRYVDHLE